MTAGAPNMHVGADWHRLDTVAVVSPEFFAPITPINATQRRFFGTTNEPTANGLVAQHSSAVEALAAAGVRVIYLTPTRNLPMQFNIRDSAVVIGSTLVLGNMAKAVRVPEPQALSAGLRINAVPNECHGILEGGDVIVTPAEIFVGLGERTNELGFDSLRETVAPQWQLTPIRLLPGVLHLDVAMSLLSANLGILHRGSIEGELPQSLRSVEWLEISDDEFAQQAANVLVVSEEVVMLDVRHERLQRSLTERGFQCLRVALDQITKVGGGVRCMTLPLVRTP